MSWLQALLLGLVQGLTEFLPVSSSGHLMIFRELLGVNPEGFMDFTVAVHFATVLSTIVVFRKPILDILKGVFKFRLNDQTDYALKIIISIVPVGIVGLFFKDKVEALFGDSLTVVGICLAITAVLLFLSDMFGKRPEAVSPSGKEPRNGISVLQAFVVGCAQALAVAPGLSRSGTTIATGLLTGVRRDVIAQFSFLMVLVPILGEQLLDLLDIATGEAVFGAGAGAAAIMAGSAAAFLSGLFACKAMVALVRRAKLSWFAAYCLAAAVLIFIIA
ncbi:MAG: undecaprenyl-diphosphate phosphatase [Candidatus Cryptobacteroides sp.]